MLFRDIVGQAQTKRQLIQLVTEGKLPHALMLTGGAGVGKLPLALALARYLQCTQRTATDACGTCPSCRKHNILQHPDMHYTYPTIKSAKCDDLLPQWRKLVGATPYFDIQQWLSAMGTESAQAIIYAAEGNIIQQKLSRKPYEAIYKVMLIWLPERMNSVCANKLLKLIEEPAPNTLILLVSNQPDLVLPTIQSRCQRVMVHPLPQEEIALALTREAHLTHEDATSIARVAEGSYTKAMELISLSEENQLFFDLFVQLMRLSYSRNIKELRSWGEQVAKLGREGMQRLLAYAGRMVRESFIYNLNYDELNYMSRQEAQFASKFAPFINESNVMGIAQEIERAERDIAGNANAKIVLLDMAISLILLLKK